MILTTPTLARCARFVALGLACALLAGCSAGVPGRGTAGRYAVPSQSALAPRTPPEASMTLHATATPGLAGRAASGAAEPSGTLAGTATPSAGLTAALDDSRTVVPGYELLSPSAARAAKAKRVAVPMLMYHAIGDTPLPGSIPDLFVTKAAFSAQMDYLAQHGYQPVTLQRVYDFWQGRATLPDKPIVITFDDGFTTDYTYVAPLLAEKHWPAVLFLIVGRHKPRMYPSTIRAMIADGWEIDSHTITHEDLPGLGAKRVKREVAGSRLRLQRMYGVPVNFFCYPSGRFDPQTVAAVRAAGYLGATTTEPGLARANEPFTLRRIRVGRGESLSDLEASLKIAK